MGILNFSHFCLLPRFKIRTKAQQAFGKKYLRLITAKNRVLYDFNQTLEESGIEDGECLAALILQPQVAAAAAATFALWQPGDSAIITWGDADCGGDSSAVRDQLRGVQQIQASLKAFAAILEDGSVVTWGDANYGGTVWQFEISWEVCSRLRPLFRGPLLRFWRMDPSLPGVMQTVAVTVRQFEISSEVCSRFKPLWKPLLRFWKMDPSLPGVMQTMVVQFGSSRSAERCAPDSGHSSGDLCCDSGGWIRRYLGWCRLWRWQFGSSRSAQRCAADSSLFESLCCDSGRWIHRYLGWCRLWRWQFGSSRSAERCAPDSGHSSGDLCCDSGGWIRRYLGWCRLWRWQFGSSRSAQRCAADSSLFESLCCDSGRWIRRYLGWCRLWRWQFGSSRSAQRCAADSSLF